MQPDDLSNQLKRRAQDLGFQHCGICPAVAPPGLSRLDAWLEAGYAGQMHYLSDRRHAYDHPRHVLDGVRSIVMVAMHYSSEPSNAPVAGQGRIARYAWGAVDYHDLIRGRLHQLADFLRELAPSSLTRGVVDTAPLAERELAQIAGLGWIGKNTLLISKSAGSYFFLAALLTDQTLAYDNPHAANHCGTCTACLDCCPTDAFPQPYVLDATRCISYLTIELQETIPLDLRHGMGDWLFGCDVCQDVCPWNRDAPCSAETDFAPCEDKNPMKLAELLELDEQQFRARFRHTPLWRAHRRGLLRNAAIVLGNQRATEALPALVTGLQDEEPLVRGASAWAIGQLKHPAGEKALRVRLSLEADSQVIDEINSALRGG